nr:hypothetical protein CFP56_70472 [Quercus suber]
MKEHANQKVLERERFYSSALHLEASSRAEKKKTVLFRSLKEAQKMVNVITSIKESHPSPALPMSLILSICPSVLESNLLCNVIT